jgi:hypothetical protein
MYTFTYVYSYTVSYYIIFDNTFIVSPEDLCNYSCSIISEYP